MTFQAFTGGAFAENGYLVRCDEADRVVMVDPGAAAGAMLEALDRRDASPDAILLTHAHLDHVEGLPAVLARHPGTPVHLHPADLPLYRAMDEQAAMFGLKAPELPEPDHALEEGQEIRVGSTVTLRVCFTPGHAPGHVIFVADDARVALVGDVVFQGSIGRTDLPGGNLRELMASIRGQVLSLPDDTRLLPGHGPETTVGRERMGNPFLVPNYLGHFA